MLGVVLMLAVCGRVGRLLKRLWNGLLGGRKYAKPRHRRPVRRRARIGRMAGTPGHDRPGWEEKVPSRYRQPSSNYNLLIHLKEGRLWFSEALLKLCGEATFFRVTNVFAWSNEQEAHVLFPHERAEDVIALLNWVDPGNEEEKDEGDEPGLPIISSHGLCLSQIPALARMTDLYHIPRFQDLWPNIIKEHISNCLCLNDALAGLEIIDALHTEFMERYRDFESHFRTALKCAFSFGLTPSMLPHRRISEQMELRILKAMLTRLGGTLRSLVPSTELRLHCQYHCTQANTIGLCDYHRIGNFLERYISYYAGDEDLVDYAPLY